MPQRKSCEKSTHASCAHKCHKYSHKGTSSQRTSRGYPFLQSEQEGEVQKPEHAGGQVSVLSLTRPRTPSTQCTHSSTQALSVHPIPSTQDIPSRSFVSGASGEVSAEVRAGVLHITGWLQCTQNHACITHTRTHHTRTRTRAHSTPQRTRRSSADCAYVRSGGCAGRRHDCDRAPLSAQGAWVFKRG